MMVGGGGGVLPVFVPVVLDPVVLDVLDPVVPVLEVPVLLPPPELPLPPPPPHPATARASAKASPINPRLSAARLPVKRLCLRP